MDEQRLDDFFKEHLDDFQDDGSADGAWGNMDAVLSQHTPSPQQGVFVQRWILWTAAALLLLLIGSFFYSLKNQSQQIEMLYSSVDSLKEELDGRGRTMSRVDTLVLLADAEGNLHAISPEKLAELSEASLPAMRTEREAGRAADTYISTKQSSTNLDISNKTYTPDSPAPSLIVKSIDSTNFFTEKMEPDSVSARDSLISREIESNQVENMASKEKARDSVKIESKNLAEEPTEREDKPEVKRDNFLKRLASQLGFRSGVGVFVGGGGNEYGETSPVIGGDLGLELSVGDRFSIRSGVRVSSLNYELDGLENQILSEDFLRRYPGIGTIDPGANLHELKMNGNFVSIPIGVRYYHPVKRKTRVFSGIDVSGGSYLSQNFTYEFIQNGGEFYNSAKAPSNPWVWGTGRISLGAQYVLKSDWQLETALFFEKDLQGRGVEKYKFYMIGLSTSLWLSH